MSVIVVRPFPHPDGMAPLRHTAAISCSARFPVFLVERADAKSPDGPSRMDNGVHIGSRGFEFWFQSVRCHFIAGLIVVGRCIAWRDRHFRCSGFLSEGIVYIFKMKIN